MGNILFLLAIKIDFIYLIYEVFLNVVFLFVQTLYIHVQKAFPAFCEDYFKFFSLNWG